MHISWQMPDYGDLVTEQEQDSQHEKKNSYSLCIHDGFLQNVSS